MRALRPALLVMAVLWLAPAPLARAADTIESMLLEASTPARLRAALLGFAGSAPDSAASAKAAALLYAGSSYERAGRADSALGCFERAVALRGVSEDRDAYADALFDRGRPGDAARALEVLGPRLQVALTNSERDIAQTKGRQAWALFLQDRGDSALAMLRSQQRWLLDPITPRQRDWRYRIGLLELAHGDLGKCVEVMLPLALESRFQDRDVMGILKDAAQKAPQGPGLAAMMKQQLARIDAQEQKVLEAMGGRRVAFSALDGFTLGAVTFPALRRPARAVVVLMDPEEIVDAYDSLAAGLTRAGYGVVIVEARGSGWSVAPSCPLPSTRRGREDELRDLGARDALPALRALAASTRVDTSAYLVVGALGSCAMAAKAASLDRRARPLLLVSPSPSPAERGAMRAWLAAAGAPVFFEVPVTDHATPIAEALYAALDPRASRIAESDRPGSAASIFRYDASALPRLLVWLEESWGSKRAPSEKGRGRR